MFYNQAVIKVKIPQSPKSTIKENSENSNGPL